MRGTSVALSALVVLGVAHPVAVRAQGAEQPRTLVMPFDRGYAAIRDGGKDANLFSFTLLGVNRETASASRGGGGGLFDGHKVPGFEVPLALAIVAISALAMRGRRSA